MGIYQPLFTVSVQHGYFADGVWKGLTFVPCRATADLIGKAGVIVRDFGNGIGVACDQDRARALELYAQDGGGTLGFGFKVYAQDRSFPNYTTPSGLNEGRILYFSNAGNGAAEDAKVNVSKGEFVSEADFTDVEELVAGQMLDARDVRVPPDFVVRIQLPFGGTGAGRVREFGMRFRARYSFWKYYLLGNVRRDSAFIVDLDNRVEFEACGESVLPGNRPAMVFRSTERLPVLENSSYRFQLREQGPGSGRVLVKRLPVAAETRLGRDMIDGKSEIILENYVNY